MGVITGEMLVDGRPRDVSFARKTGYCQQQDLHLETSTVREALQFSALLRQSADVPRKEKIEYVEEIIKLLEMDAYADAVVGVPGVGESGGLSSHLVHAWLTRDFAKVSTLSNANVSPLALSWSLNLLCCSSSMSQHRVWTHRPPGPS
jgi:hypothetical protein